jgi:GxxExxY protein
MDRNDKTESELSRTIIGCAVEVHRTLGGPGLLEDIYEEALEWELEHAGLAVGRQVALPVVYKGHALASRLRIDLVVSDRVIVECKSTLNYSDVFEAQLLTYLRLTGLKLGLVINFGETTVRKGVHRVVNGL